MSVDWYARKLNNPTTPVRQDPTPSRFAPMQVPSRPQVATTPPQVPTQHAMDRFDPEYYASLPEGQARVQYLEEHVHDGPGTKDAKLCPNCGADSVFSRIAAHGRHDPNRFPSPECFICGWPNLQSGSMGVTVQGG